LSEQDSNPPVSTGGGDDGTTTLLGSERIGKDDPRIVVVGDLDEASSFLGLARADAD
jgi:cob(I)alamin adenosyltransferase